MLGGVPPDSELAREIRLAEEAEQRDTARLRTVLIKMTSETPKTPSRAPKKPAPTPETKPPTEAKKAQHPMLPAKKPVIKNEQKSPTKHGDKPTSTRTDSRAAFDKRLETAWGEEAVRLFVDASNNFIMNLLKLKDLPWHRVVDRVTQAREDRIAPAREAGKRVAPWLPLDVEIAARELSNPIPSTKRTKSQASPDPSVSSSTRQLPSPSIEAENNRFKKRKITQEPAMSGVPAPVAQMQTEPESTISDSLPENPKKEACNNSRATDDDDESAQQDEDVEMGEFGFRADDSKEKDIEDEPGRDEFDEKKLKEDEAGKDEPKKDEMMADEHHATSETTPVETPVREATSSRSLAGKFYNCLESIAEASAMGWKVWDPQQSLRAHDPPMQMPSSAPLFVPLLGSVESGWGLLVVQADRRWAMVYSSSTDHHAHLQTMAKELIPSPSKMRMIFPAPIYQEDTSSDEDLQGLVLLIAACYRAAACEVPMIVENLQAWRFVMDLLSGGEDAGNFEDDSDTSTLTMKDILRSDTQDQVALLCKLAKNLCKTTKLEHDLSTLLADSDLPACMPITTCAQVFAKLASECLEGAEASKEVDDRMKGISGLLIKAEKAKDWQGSSDFERLSPALNGVLQALAEKDGD